MKIILLVDYLPSGNNPAGGLQNYTLRVAQALHTLGEDVGVICRTNAQQDLYDFPVRSIRVSYREKKLLNIIQSLTFHKIDNSLTLLLDAWAARRECQKIPDVDIIQSPNYKFMGLFVNHRKARLIVRASSYRPVWTEEVKPSLDGKVNFLLEKRLFKRADRVFAPSKHLAGILEAVLNRQVDVQPTPAPDTRIKEDPSWYDQNLNDRKYILYFGTLLKRKGLFLLAEAMTLVWEKQPEVLLVLAGPDLMVNGKSNYRRFLEIIDSNQDKVIYASNLNQDALFPVIRHSYFTVSPSIEDNCPNSMLEAMALGKVVLGSTGSSMDEFYPSSCQELLVPREEVHALVEKILWLWTLPQEQVELFGEECRNYIEQHHSLTGTVTALRDYYERISSQG